MEQKINPKIMLAMFVLVALITLSIISMQNQGLLTVIGGDSKEEIDTGEVCMTTQDCQESSELTEIKEIVYCEDGTCKFMREKVRSGGEIFEE